MFYVSTKNFTFTEEIKKKGAHVSLDCLELDE